MTLEQLNASSKKDLADKAKSLGIAGFAAMKKDDLVKAILRGFEEERSGTRKGESRQGKADPGVKEAGRCSQSDAEDRSFENRSQGRSCSSSFSRTRMENRLPSLLPLRPPKSGRRRPPPAKRRPKRRPLRKRSAAANSRWASRPRDLSAKMPKNLPQRLRQRSHRGHGARSVLAARLLGTDAASRFRRAEAALGQDWHGSKPIIRLAATSVRRTPPARPKSVVRDIEIHGGCNNWYIEVSQPPQVLPGRHRLRLASAANFT